MSRPYSRSLAVWMFCAAALLTAAEPPSKAKTVEQIAEAVHPSIAVLTVSGRDGNDASLGAGFVVSADGLIVFRVEDDKSYGFYPSGGKFRLTRFDGPDVFSWKVLGKEASSDYRPGGWNVLKVHLEKDHIRCYVNSKIQERRLARRSPTR